MKDYWVKGTESKEAKERLLKHMDDKYGYHKEEDGDIIYNIGFGQIILQGLKNNGNLFMITLPNTLTLNENSNKTNLEKEVLNIMKSEKFELEVAE